MDYKGRKEADKKGSWPKMEWPIWTKSWGGGDKSFMREGLMERNALSTLILLNRRVGLLDLRGWNRSCP